MEENEAMEQEVQERGQDQADAFGAGFDELDAAAGANQPEAEEESGGPGGTEEAAGDESDQDETDREETGDGQGQEVEEAATEPAQEPGPEPEPPKTWEVNHLGQRRTMGAEDITPELLQKGLDYDRIHQQYDRVKPVMSVVSLLAQQAGMTVEDYMRSVRTEAKMSGGLNEEEARRSVELEDREAAVAAKEAQEKAVADAREGEEARVQRDVAEFAKAFPEVYEASRKDPGAIPDSVWEAVRDGLSLTAAYAKYAVDQAGLAAREAQAQARAAEQGHKNARRSTGSMTSAGSGVKNTDAFAAGFDE